jgi:hypothetical protein
MSAPNRLLTNVVFGTRGNAGAYQSGAWSGAEDGHCWSLSPGCALTLPMAASAEDAVMVLEVFPQTVPPERPSRTMVILRDGQYLAALTLEKRGVYGIPLGAVQAGSALGLDFHFDAPVPVTTSDMRPLAFAFRSLRVIARGQGLGAVAETRKALFPAGIDVASARDAAAAMFGEPLKIALARFESLGHSCDFGLFQRQCGAEPLGLLRFGAIPTYGLVDGLIDHFAELGRPGAVEVVLTEEWGNEYVMYDPPYGLIWHSFLTPEQAAPEQLLAREMDRLPYLKRLFLNKLASGQRIFVLRRPDPMTLSEAEAVAAALWLHSDCAIIWAVENEGDPGSVDRLSRNFFRGHLESPDHLGMSSIQSWLSICANTQSMLRG